jgi:hypothetical protein
LKKVCKKLFICVNYVIFIFHKHICIAVGIRFVKKQFFGAGVLRPPVWEPSPSFLGGPASAPKTDLPAPLPATISGAPVEMLLEDDRWCKAMQEEYDALIQNKSWHLVLPILQRIS